MVIIITLLCIYFRYPSRATKTNLAMSIINAFPKLHSGGPLGYVYYLTLLSKCN